MRREEMTTEKKGGIGLTTQIFVGLFLGIVFGYLFPKYGVALKPVGDMFIRMIKMIVVPLVFSSLVMGIAGAGDFKKVGRLGVKSLVWFEIATTLALVIGLFVVNVVKPGAGVIVTAGDTSAVAAAAQKSVDMMQMIVNLVPTNIVDSMARGDMLQIVFFSSFFGIAAAAAGPVGRPVIELANSVAEIMFKFTWYVMKVAPIGVFALIAFTVGKFGLGMLIPLAKLIFALFGALLIFIFTVLAGVCVICKIPFWDLMKALKEPILIAFSTASSEAALPLAMQKMEEFGVPKEIVSFVMPTGYTFNLDGSTLYTALAVVFVAQVYNIPFDLSHQVMMLVVLMLATKGIAAVPGASLIVIAGTVASFGLPVEGVAIILGVDRLLDMARTTCNLIGNCVASAVVARWEGQFDDNKMKQFIINSDAQAAVDA
jgi:proton glutamate symport protein